MKISLKELYPGFDLECPAIHAPIEPGVLPVCESLNALPSVHTLWSCEGHAGRPSLPYVIFIAPQSLAFKVHLLLAQSAIRTGLHYNRHLKASFRFDGSLQYKLEPDDFRLENRGFSFFLLFKRAAMDKELGCLANLLLTLPLINNIDELRDVRKLFMVAGQAVVF